MAAVNWRTINIDALDPDSPANFDLTTLTPALAPVSASDVQSLATQIRQLLRGGDSEGALRGALENAPYGADERGKVSSTTSPWGTVDLMTLLLWHGWTSGAGISLAVVFGEQSRLLGDSYTIRSHDYTDARPRKPTSTP